MPYFYVIKSLADDGTPVLLTNFFATPDTAWTADHADAMRHTHRDEAKAALAWVKERCDAEGAKHLAVTFKRAVVCRDANPPLAGAPKRRGLESQKGGEEGVDAEGREYVTAGVSAPGIVRWAVAHGGCKRDVPFLANVLAGTWHLPAWVATAIVTKRMPYTVDEDAAVVVTF